MRSICLLIILQLSLSFHSILKYNDLYIYLLWRKPSQKDYDNMDEFERFEKHTDEQDWEKQNEYLWKIYYKINNITEPTKVLHLDFTNMIDVMDKNMMTNLMGKIPKDLKLKKKLLMIVLRDI